MKGSEISDEDLIAHWHSVTSSVRRTERRINAIVEDSGVPAQWFAVLHLLLRAVDHRMPMSALARELSMSSGGFTKLADRMAREDLIDRRGSAADRRVVNATLTRAGTLLAQRAAVVYQGALREYLLGVVSAADLASVATTMRVLGAAHAAPVEVDEAPEPPTTQHRPALPEWRGRGRASGQTSHRSSTPTTNR